MKKISTVNIVGAGLLDQEFDLNYLATSLPGDVRYEPEMHPGLYLRVETHGPLAIIYRTGKFIITGATSEEEVHSTKDSTINIISEAIQHHINLTEFGICNYVLSGDLDVELDLNTLSVGLGLEETEYNPETHPAVLYTPEQFDCTIMIFRSGKVNIAGGNDESESEKAFWELNDKIKSLMAKE
ncbi:TATA-box-binding protein [Salinigranum halophilum]|uniref:TATA-box-binding protein C n=1 Tax=Salinigranum halophilum TaxID=2565931 RepID=UPI0010A87DAE|nr:TATA-box-binding protein C [Salinigranum halophilum]